MKQSSIEWLAEKTFSPFITEEKYNDIIRQAKAMHKEEMKESYWESLMSRHQSFEKYYEETFNQNSK